jgi:hypothetical protein
VGRIVERCSKHGCEKQQGSCPKCFHEYMSKKKKCPDCKGTGHYGRFGNCSKCDGLGLI